MALQDRDVDNNVIREYAWGLNLGGGIGGLLNIHQDNANYTPLYDGKGNIIAVLDSSQAIVAQYRYGTFGVLEAKTGTVDQPFGFSTKRTDPALGLVYYGYRFYSPSLERWLNRDPIGEQGGINLYAFIGNNPVNWVDPWGLDRYEMKMAGGNVGYLIFGGGVYDVTILNLDTGKYSFYTMKVLGLGVGLPSFRFDSSPIMFESDCDDFSGFGYIGGISIEASAGFKYGGGIKIPNVPFISPSVPHKMRYGLEHISEENGGVDIGVSHSITYWTRYK